VEWTSCREIVQDCRFPQHDKADVEITRGVCKHREEGRLGKVERDDTALAVT